jgi:hypothetical protein
MTSTTLGAPIIVGTPESTREPLLGPLANNGGPTLTQALSTSSPAVGAGLTVAGITTDQRGVLRANPPALGAVEAQSSGVQNPTSPGTTSQSLLPTLPPSQPQSFSTLYEEFQWDAALAQQSVLSGNFSAFSQQANKLFQVTQQLLEAEFQASLEPLLDSIVMALPGISQGLNAAASDLSASHGPQLGQLETQKLIRAVDSGLHDLEDATLSALHAVGDDQDPTFNGDVAFINAFTSDPLHYVPPS